jgi:hypothetical protein
MPSNQAGALASTRGLSSPPLNKAAADRLDHLALDRRLAHCGRIEGA